MNLVSSSGAAQRPAMRASLSLVVAVRLCFLSACAHATRYSGASAAHLKPPRATGACQRRPPERSSEARRQGVSGPVTVDVTVDEHGAVRSVDDPEDQHAEEQARSLPRDPARPRRGAQGVDAAHREQLLFPALHGGPITNNVLNHWYDELCRLAGVRAITSHGARHTSGSSYAVMGAGQKMIARLLGHANTGATERYTHVQADATTGLVEARWARLVGLPRT